MSAVPQQQPVQQDLSLQKMGLKWLLGQEANTVLLFAILASLGYGFWWALTTGIPNHLSQIQKGYETLEERHDKSRAEDRAAFKEEMSAGRAMFKETLDRIGRLPPTKQKDE